MPDCWESIKADGETIADRLKDLILEGNVRRIVVQHKGRTVAEFPLTAGIVWAGVAPVLAAIGALTAQLEGCTIQLEHVGRERAPQREIRAAVH